MDYTIGSSLTAADRAKLSGVRSDLLKTDASPAMASAIAASIMVDDGDFDGAREEICRLLDGLRARDTVSEAHGDAVHDIFGSIKGHTLQNTIVRGLLETAVSISGSVTPLKIGERVGGIHTYITQLARHHASQRVSINTPSLPLAA